MPIQESDPALLRRIQRHYDDLSPWYHLCWGEHIHHGFWRGAQSRAEAQIALICKLVEFASIPQGARVLDVGCGLGGSAFWLAANLNCAVTGISLSPNQIAIANMIAEQRHLAQK